MKCLRPEYINDFQCDGKLCGSRCCIGWQIIVDEQTYNKYCSVDEKSEILSHLENIENGNNFTIKLGDNLECPFLDDDYLCKLQKHYGEDFLTAICHSYPRVTYRVGDILEQSLTLTCPIAAKLILLSNEPLEFEEVDIEEPRAIFDWTDKVLDSAEKSIDLQMSAIRILSNKNLSIDSRLFELCKFFYDKDIESTTINFDIKKHSDIMIKIFSKMYDANLTDNKKLELQSIYIENHKMITNRLMNDYGYVFERYICNEFFMRLYPFAFKGDTWRNCRIFIIGFKALKFAMVLMAISKNGILSTDELLNMIDAINERLDHNRGGMKIISDFANIIDDFKDFTNLMLDLS